MDYRPEIRIMKLFKENIGENLSNLGFGEDIEIQWQKHDTWKKKLITETLLKSKVSAL